MTGFDKEQLDALRRQVEEEFRLDLAAIERLQRRYAGVAGIPAAIPGGVPNGNYAPASSSVASNSYPSASAAYSSQGNGLNADTRSAAIPSNSNQPDSQEKELSGALRSMFKSVR
ncbi:MAG TPA: hypothetical protein VKB38_05520 [Terracidiphilus sp.]|nr:hypothetical protein [Terracidiphilus sp.]